MNQSFELARGMARFHLDSSYRTMLQLTAHGLDSGLDRWKFEVSRPLSGDERLRLRALRALLGRW